MQEKQWLVIVVMLVINVIPIGCNGAMERVEQTDLGQLQATDETILVEMRRPYTHSFPGGFYQEYALNNVGAQIITINLVPIDNNNTALAIFNAANKTDAILRLDEGKTGEAEMIHFTPDPGLNYLVQVYEVEGQTAKYEITFTL